MSSRSSAASGRYLLLRPTQISSQCQYAPILCHVDKGRQKRSIRHALPDKSLGHLMRRSAAVPIYPSTRDTVGNNTNSGQSIYSSLLSDKVHLHHDIGTLVKNNQHRTQPKKKETWLEYGHVEEGAAGVTLNTFQATEAHGEIERQKNSQVKPNSAFMVTWRTLYHQLRYPDHGNLVIARSKFEEQCVMATEFIGNGNVQDIRQRWREIYRPQRAWSLPSIFIGALATSAKQTLILLSSMDQVIPRQFTVYADCLIYLKVMYKDELEGDSSLSQAFRDEVTKIRNPTTWPRHSLSEVYLEILLQDCPVSEKHTIVHQYLEMYKFLSRSSLLFVVDFYIRERKVVDAIETLSRLPEQALQKSDPDVLDRCIHLLYQDSVEQKGSSQGFAILPQLLKLGIRPNDLLHNMVLRNALLSGLPNVAWDLYRYMKAENMDIAARSHLMLLKDSFQRQDTHGMHEIMSAIHQRDDLAKNPYIVAYTMNVVRVLCYSERHASPDESFAHILAVYDRAYDRAPLTKLGIASTREKESSTTLVEAGPIALGFTIWSYVLVQNRESIVSTLWEWIVYHIRAKDPDIINAAKHDILYNGFILFYSKWPSTLIKGLNILNYMLDSNLCEPTARTWSLMICSFLRHGHDQSADRIRQMMVAHNVRIDDEALKFVLEKYPQSDIAAKVGSILDGHNIPEDLATAMETSQSS